MEERKEQEKNFPPPPIPSGEEGEKEREKEQVKEFIEGSEQCSWPTLEFGDITVGLLGVTNSGKTALHRALGGSWPDAFGGQHRRLL